MPIFHTVEFVESIPAVHKSAHSHLQHFARMDEA
jgi:hypothetical protein